jgi:hypothetical protein
MSQYDLKAPNHLNTYLNFLLNISTRRKQNGVPEAKGTSYPQALQLHLR